MVDSSLPQGDKTAEPDDGKLVDVTIQLPVDLYRAYQRGCLMISSEVGRDRNELAKEMVTDFLIKYGC